MRSKLHWASGVAVAATMFTALVAAEGTSVAAEERIGAAQEATEVATDTKFISEPVVQELPVEPDPVPGETTESIDISGVVLASSLREHIAAQPQPRVLTRELNCLAGAIYFEARGESLEGQLAVGRVIVERAESRRFPGSYCGVVFQRSQFSFVRGGRMPAIRKASKAWKRAVALAQIAHDGSWDSPVEGALFFHATHVSPGWRLKRLARVDNHIFYR